MAAIAEITGVILAGGQSSRFGGNKAIALWRDKFLIQHVKETLASVFADCLLVTNTPEQYAFLGLPMTADRYPGMGPVAGIHAALHHTEKSWIFVAGCDMPALTADLIVYLCSLARPEDQAVIPWLTTGAEPLCGLYQKTALDSIELQLKNNRKRARDMLEALSVRKVGMEELQKVADLRVFTSVNRAPDLDSLP